MARHVVEPSGARRRVVMLLENNPYPLDVRVRDEAESLVAAGYDVKVIAPRGEGEPSSGQVRGVRVSRFRLPDTPSTLPGFLAEYLLANVQLQARAAAELARGADILHLHNPPDTLFPIAAVARALGRRVVFDHHDLAPELFAAKFDSSLLGRLLRAFERATFRWAHVVLAANESHRRVAIERGGLDAKDVFVVRNGPHQEALERSTPGREGRLDDPHLVFLGAMGSQDGVELLLPVMRRLHSVLGLPGARLTLVGDGPSRAALEQAFAGDGLGEAVRFTGRVPHAHVPELLATADICVDPAPGTEVNHLSTMVKIAEYMAAGRPIAAFELRETARTAGDAALFAPSGQVELLADNVARLAAEPALRSTLAARARERVEELTWERSEEALLGAYRHLLGPAAARAG